VKRTIVLAVFLVVPVAFAQNNQEHSWPNPTPNFFALYDQNGPSGVPLGGIGVGTVDLAPDGRFSRMAINNWLSDESGIDRARRENPEWEREAFLSVWERDAEGHTIAQRLIRTADNAEGMTGYRHSIYRGLFPTAQIAFEDGVGGDLHSVVSVKAHSSLIPHNVKDSALPAFWIEVTLANSSSKPVEASVAFSWPDIISRGLTDLADLKKVPDDATQFDPSILSTFPRESTSVAPLDLMTFTGVRQFGTPLRPHMASFQNYVNEVAILAEKPTDGIVTYLPAWSDSDARDAFAHFRQVGEFSSQFAEQALSASNKQASASAVAIKARIEAGGKKTFRFLVVWYMPELKITSTEPHARFGTADYGRYFHNYFGNLNAVASYEIQERERLDHETLEWQRPILESTLPRWLQFKIINSAYTLYTNTILNKAGAFTVMEGGMWGLAGTMDQRLSAHPFYQKFFTELDRAELQQFADSQDADGGILHFDANYLVGITDHYGNTPTPHDKMVDNTASWIIQVAKDYQQTGDNSFIKKNAAAIRRGMKYMHDQIRDDSQIPVGPQTYDDFPHPPIYSYLGTVYLAALKATVVLGGALNDERMVTESQAQFDRTRAGLIKTLWNGHFLAYGSDIGGVNRRDDRVFTGQLAGQFISRYAGWGDLLPMEMVQSSIRTQLTTSVQNTPNYYAPKVWDIEMQRGVDDPGSQCWPFYLESYTAMAGVQAGFLDDGLEIMRNIQLVHLRGGWTWSQDLWNPGELTYMTAPVSWFVTDVLTGAALDLPNHRLTLGVASLHGENIDRLPIFTPRFWAELEVVRSQRKVRLHILRTFGASPLVIDNLIALPPGVPSASEKHFSLRREALQTGSVIDLSPYFDAITNAAIAAPVLGPEN
jgi:non-lysosomal glucosylceramidase